jgi:glyoxylase-like metal-dependent hydrolase (beta-lactamase superfamily II)
MLEWRRQTSRNAPIIEIDIPLADGDELDVPGRTLVAISTPGHSAGHLCFHDPGNRLLFAGDVVLPKRNPPIGSFALDEQVDPLSDFFDSLDRLAELDGCLVLPGHGDPFTGPAADAERLRSHHEKRMRALTAYLASGPVTLWEAAVAAPWSQPWEDLSPMAKLLSLGKVHAHLIALIRRGLVRRLDSDVARYVLAETPAIRTTGPVSA